ncbi:YtxH domain-containing protein [Actinotalea sp. BY-33]|uniref:YtxH domain-containing protein n=1 Tax=Actinotalea soli TaxID=2819234 RepID=A0A939RTY7_9CELL|nr:YtxH domain-containing protein [Actinotalea soli]MBO1750670.1 YtxH domain-containing protein [Actinotalea soli]
MKAAFLVGGAVGYVLGTRAGRQQFDKIRSKAQELWEDPRVQDGISDVEHRASDLVREKGPEIKEKVTGAVKSASEQVRGGKDQDSGTNGTASSSTTGSGTV